MIRVKNIFFAHVVFYFEKSPGFEDLYWIKSQKGKKSFHCFKFKKERFGLKISIEQKIEKEKKILFLFKKIWMENLHDDWKSKMKKNPFFVSNLE